MQVIVTVGPGEMSVWVTVWVAVSVTVWVAVCVTVRVFVGPG